MLPSSQTNGARKLLKTHTLTPNQLLVNKITSLFETLDPSKQVDEHVTIRVQSTPERDGFILETTYVGGSHRSEDPVDEAILSTVFENMKEMQSALG